MNAEIVITGLCSMLNVTGRNHTMGDPSFIAVRTPHDPANHADHHITYIAFDSRQATVDAKAASAFKNVPKADHHLYLPIDGVEIVIDGVAPGTPVVDDMYRNFIVRKDHYWPEAKDDWNRDYVPVAGDKPKKTAVTAFMRFGGGNISADRISLVEWVFPRVTGGPHHRGHFAEEVVYSGFPTSDKLVVKLKDLEKPYDILRDLTFTPTSTTDPRVTLIIGNNVEDDMSGSVERRITRRSKANNHFQYLNQVANKNLGLPPNPIPVNPPSSSPGTGGGENSGTCGPGSGNN